MTSCAGLRHRMRQHKPSYREPDSETELDSDIALNTAPKRRQPTRACRPRPVKYLEQSEDQQLPVSSDSSSDEVVVDVSIGSNPATPPRRSQPVRGRRRARPNYAEESDEDIPELSDSSVPPRSLSTSRKPESYPGASMAARANSRESSSKLPFRASKRQRTSHKSEASGTAVVHRTSVPGITFPVPSRSGRIPPWQTLPPHVLSSIMKYAAYPLYVGASKDTGSMRWLLNTSELCSSFHDACIGVLLYNPPTYPAHRADHLLWLLRSSQQHFAGSRSPVDEPAGVTRSQRTHRPSLDYRTKVQELSLEVKSALVSKSGIGLSELLAHTPLLKKLTLYHNHDSLADKYLWATPASDRSFVRWSYDSGHLFESLADNSIRLDAFEWNGRFMRDDPNLDSFESKQLTSTSLRRLKSLTIRNFSLPNVESLWEHVIGENIIVPKLLEDEKAQRLVKFRATLRKALHSFPELTDLTLHTCNIIDNSLILNLPSNLTRLRLTKIPFFDSESLQSYLNTSGVTLANLALEGNQLLSLGFLSTLATATPRLRDLVIDLTYHDPTSFHDTEPFFDSLLPFGPPTWPSTLEAVCIGPLRNLEIGDAEAFFQSLVDAAPNLPYLRILQIRTLLKAASWRDRARLRSEWDLKLHECFHVKQNPAVSPPSNVLTAGELDKQGRKSSRLSQEKVTYPTKTNGRVHTLLFELSDQRPAAEQFREEDFLDEEPEGDAEWNARDDRIEAPLYNARRYAW